MSKSTILNELIHHDLKQNSAILNRYYQSSNLPIREKIARRPKPCKFRRDKVSSKLLNKKMENITKGLLNENKRREFKL